MIYGVPSKISIPRLTRTDAAVAGYLKNIFLLLTLFNLQLCFWTVRAHGVFRFLPRVLAFNLNANRARYSSNPPAVASGASSGNSAA